MKIRVQKEIKEEEKEVEMNLSLVQEGSEVNINATDQFGKEWTIGTISSEGLRLWMFLPTYYPIDNKNSGRIKLVRNNI